MCEADERELTVLEQENAALKKSDELQTIALRALATKDEFTKLRETNNAIFDVLINHDQLTNERLGDLQAQVIELDGKVMGLQVETRRGFKDTQMQLSELVGHAAIALGKEVPLTTVAPEPARRRWRARSRRALRLPPQGNGVGLRFQPATVCSSQVMIS